MPTEMEFPSHIKEWKQSNPRAFDFYSQEFLGNREAQIQVIKNKVEPIAAKTVENINSRHLDVWKAFRQAAKQLDDPADPNQIMGLYDAMYAKLEFENKKKLAYHMGY